MVKQGCIPAMVHALKMEPAVIINTLQALDKMLKVLRCFYVNVIYKTAETYHMDTHLVVAGYSLSDVLVICTPLYVIVRSEFTFCENFAHTDHEGIVYNDLYSMITLPLHQLFVTRSS
jgi:hypothetical protein